jgi:hypothetical protein
MLRNLIPYSLMTDPFKTHIRNALANPGLQAALDSNAERRLNALQWAYASAGLHLAS